MQKLAEICIRRPVFATMIILALVVVGSASYFRLGVDRYPAMDLPVVSVRASLRGASPEEVETSVAQVLERAINTVEGIEELRSMCGQGSCFISVTFSLDRDIDVATQDVRDRVSAVLRQLPDDTDPPVVEKRDNDSQPVLTAALSGPRSLRELYELADKIVRPQIERSTGVGQVSIDGGLRRSINVWVDADKIAAYELPITAVGDAIARQNSDIPGGNVTGPNREQVLRTMGQLTDARDFNDLAITTINGAPIRIQDVGMAEDGTQEQRSTSRLNGMPNVSLSIYRQSKANSVEVIEAARQSLAQVAEQLPSDVKLEVIRDQSRYIYSALHEIKTHLVLGSILASLVVLMFMRNWRSTIIAAVAIPASVISTFGMMAALGFTLNSVTMLALVLMVGVVIDDAIVVLENIFRFVEEKKMNPMQAAKAATAEIGLAVMATTFSLVVIFIPVSFMSSVSGRFLYQFGITAAVAVLISLLVSFTLTPMMSARLLRVKGGGHDEARSRRGFYRLIDAAYTWMLTWSMRLRWGVAIVAIAVVASSGPLYKYVKQEFVPTDVDEGEFFIMVTGPEGTSMPAMDEAMRAIEGEVKAVPGVRLMLTSAGSGFMGSVNGGRIHIELEPHEKRLFTWGRLWKATLAGNPKAAFENNHSQREIMQQIRSRLRKFKDVRCQIRGYPAINLGGGNFDIDFGFRGAELEKLGEYADSLRKMTLPGEGGKPPRIPGIVDADITLRLDKPELRVQIDRARAADLGVDARDIGSALRLMVGGDDEVSRFRDPTLNEEYYVQLRLLEDDRNDPNLLDTLYLPRRGGGLVQLSNLATIQPANAPSRIDRVDRQRCVNLRAGIDPLAVDPATGGRYALADRMQALKDAVEEMGLPAGYSIRVAGRGRELERTFTEFLWAFLLSVIFMYMILASQYESFVHPLTILLSLPLSVPFALISLYATDGTLNLYSALGVLVLFGVVKKNAILQIDHMNNLRRQGMPRFEAIIQANRDRLRPILMTTLSLVAGMLPMALGTGPGAEERRAVAVVVIGGQSLALLLTLLVTPVVYSIFDDIGALVLGRRRQVVEQGGLPESATPQANSGV